MSMTREAKAGLGFVFIAFLVAAVIFVWWWYNNRYQTVLVPSTADGGTITLTCPSGQAVHVVSASYTPPAGGVPVDVVVPLQAAFTATAGSNKPYTISGVALGQKAGGTLTLRYKCTASLTKSGFANSKGQAGGARHQPMCQAARPHRRIDYTRNLDDREASPGEAAGDRVMDLMTAVTRRQPSSAQGRSLLLSGVDSDFAPEDNYYGGAAVEEALSGIRSSGMDSLTSTPGRMNALTGYGTGLGRRPDPRYDLGAAEAADEAFPSHGGNAAGGYFNAFHSRNHPGGYGSQWGPPS